MRDKMIPEEYTKSVCMKGKKVRQCRYLATSDKGEFVCMKVDPEYRSLIDKEIISINNNINDISVLIELPIADNCNGYSILKTIKDSDIIGNDYD